MSRLAQINQYAEATVSQLYGSTSVEDIRMHFALINRRVEALLHDIERAEKLDFLVHTDVIHKEIIIVMKEAIKCILDNSPDFVNDLNMINESGIHSIDSPSHMSYVASEIIERADTLRNGTGWKAWLKSRFTKQGYFEKRFNEAVSVASQQAKESAPTVLNELTVRSPEAA